MMKNLLKIRQEIEAQIRLIITSKEEVDRATLKKKLEKDLKKVSKIISQKEEELKKKKNVGNNNGSTTISRPQKKIGRIR